MIEIEVQNETHQSQDRLRFAAVPRIGEGLRLREKNGMWASYDVIDVWYQKADFGDVWMPYLHVRMTPGETAGDNDDDGYGDGYDREFDDDLAMRSAAFAKPRARGIEPFKI
ncbi:hypothetical protein [Erythrobacter litoralis]|uniref:Uncharacterized protein n=1 Tax=Erythrobacter litoralis (strain HTCC2594) TaxID=314225 RepID=Q2NB85_ERYLH|nr:hypothetical protein [Erythrobacter litoralis]ABC63056.1 hypothetical protein ELI_04820 [Erythrobacter litoralis HTCC2594]